MIFGILKNLSHFNAPDIKRTDLIFKNCGLLVRVPGCKLSGLGFDSRPYKVFCLTVGLKRGPLSLVMIKEELLERKVAAPV
jgi:hypothetical protein